MPTVSVIIPNYNHASYLSKRIDTVIGQTYKDIEILILDDCSSDESTEIIDKYASIDNRIKTFYNDVNSGSTFKQWNKGVNLASGKFLWIAESDDFSDLTFLSECVTVLEKDQQIALVYSNSNIVNKDNEIIAKVNNWLQEMDSEKWEKNYKNSGHNELTNLLAYRNFIPNASAVVMRRNLYLEIGGANESMKLCGDWLLYIKLLERGDIAYVAKALNYYRVHYSTVRNKYFLSYEGLNEIFWVLNYTMKKININAENLNPVKFIYIKSVWVEALIKARLNIYKLFKLFKFYKFIHQIDPSLKKNIVRSYFNELKKLIVRTVKFK